MNDLKEELVDQIYDAVLQVTNRILHNAKNFNISILKLEDPSYHSIAGQLRKACQLMKLVADELPDNGQHQYTVTKAYEYADSVAKIAEAINNGDQQELERCCEELDRRPFL